MALLVDEPPNRPSAQQFRQLVPKMGECRQVRKVFKWVLREKTLFRGDFEIGEVERSKVH